MLPPAIVPDLQTEASTLSESNQGRAKLPQIPSVCNQL